MKNHNSPLEVKSVEIMRIGGEPFIVLRLDNTAMVVVGYALNKSAVSAHAAASTPGWMKDGAEAMLEYTRAKLTRGGNYRVITLETKDGDFRREVPIYWAFMSSADFDERLTAIKRKVSALIPNASKGESNSPETETQGTTMLEKNISAFMREDSRTCVVRFPSGNQDYTFVHNIADLAVGQPVVCDTDMGMSLGVVHTVHEDLQIEPQSTKKYKWLVCRVDMAPFDAIMAENAMIEEKLSQVYKRNVRDSFRLQMLATLSDEERAQLPKSVNMSGAKSLG